MTQKGVFMRLTKGADIYSSDGEKLGTLDRVILDPVTKEVSHIVISKGLLFKANKVVAIDMVNPEIKDKITLRSRKQNLDEFQDFEETHYVDLDEADHPEAPGVPASYWYPPLNLAWWRAGGTDNPIYYPAMPMYVAKTKQNIPEGTVALEEGAKVVSKDGKHVGNIKEVIVDPQDNRVTHFVMNEGVLFKERKLIPVLWISEIDEHAVHLSSTSKVLERLPEYQPVG
jgi:uncharacterized protein YrrD